MLVDTGWAFADCGKAMCSGHRCFEHKEENEDEDEGDGTNRKAAPRFDQTIGHHSRLPQTLARCRQTAVSACRSTGRRRRAAVDAVFGARCRWPSLGGLLQGCLIWLPTPGQAKHGTRDPALRQSQLRSAKREIRGHGIRSFCETRVLLLPFRAALANTLLHGYDPNYHVHVCLTGSRGPDIGSEIKKYVASDSVNKGQDPSTCTLHSLSLSNSGLKSEECEYRGQTPKKVFSQLAILEGRVLISDAYSGSEITFQ